MRKILLGTTAVVGAALIGATAAQAQTAPTVRIGGFMEITGAYISDDNDKDVFVTRPAGTAIGTAGSVSDRRSFDFRNEFEIHVLVSGKAANGLVYGLTIELQNDNVGLGAGTAIDSDEAFLFLRSPTLGSLIIGDDDSAASQLQVRVPTIAGMGPDGNWDELLTNRGGTRNGNSYLLSGINDGSDATKIVYLSPQFFGFDFGLSYAPNAGEGERVGGGTAVDGGGLTLPIGQRDRATLENEISAAVRYRGSFGNIGVQAGFGMQMADAQSRVADRSAAGIPLTTGTATALQDVRAYTVGLSVTGFGVTVGGEYTWGQYSGTSVGRAALANGRDDSNHWVLGATYVAGAFSVGAYYGQGEQDTNPAGVSKRDQSVWGIGVAYTIAPGLVAIASYNDLSEDNSPDTAGSLGTRDVQVLYAGFRLAF